MPYRPFEPDDVLANLLPQFDSEWHGQAAPKPSFEISRAQRFDEATEVFRCGFGGPGGIRTLDLSIKSRLLYP
jgi:hypothetical protein